MRLHADLPSNAMQAQFYRTNSCAQCGRKLFAPESIEHVTDRIVRYLWSCNACGHQFEASVYLLCLTRRHGKQALAVMGKSHKFLVHSDSLVHECCDYS